MGVLVRSADWSETPLGPLPAWPADLVLTLGLTLESPLPSALWWGPTLVLLPNDAYVGLFRTPSDRGRALTFGALGFECSPSADPALRKTAARVLERGDAVLLRDQPLAIDGANTGDGSERLFTIAHSPVRDGSGRTRGVLTIAFEVARANLIQEAHVLRRTALAEREHLLSALSHDMKNPLNVIVLSAHHLGSLPLPREAQGRAKKRLDAIIRSTKHLDAKLRDLLDLARFDAGTVILHRYPHEVDALLDEAIDPLRPLAVEKAVEIERRSAVEAGGVPMADRAMSAGPPPPTDPSRAEQAKGTESPQTIVFCDRDRTRRVLAAIVENAIKYSPDGRKVTVTTTRREQEVRFAIADEGPGVPEHARDRIFDCYWTASGDGSGGLGRSLSIAKRTIEAQGGRIWLETSPERGSTFFFTLPGRPLEGSRDTSDRSSQAKTDP